MSAIATVALPGWAGMIMFAPLLFMWEVETGMMLLEKPNEPGKPLKVPGGAAGVTVTTLPLIEPRVAYK